MESSPIHFSLTELMKEITEEFNVISEKDQAIEINQIENDIQIFQDKTILRNVLINLLSNAIKYSSEKSVISINIFKQNKRLIIEVQDRGIGIPEDDQKHLFELFFRAHNAVNIQGTGLGLSIVKRYLDIMNGELTFTSIENQGTTFKINLPMEEV